MYFYALILYKYDLVRIIMELKDIVLSYFECFSKKNISSLKDFFQMM